MTTEEHLNKILAKCRENLADRLTTGYDLCASAGWRSTIAAIKMLQGSKHRMSESIVHDAVTNILAAWPEELL